MPRNAPGMTVEPQVRVNGYTERPHSSACMQPTAATLVDSGCRPELQGSDENWRM